MKINLAVFISPFAMSAFLTYLFSVHGFVVIISYFIFLGMFIGAFTFFVFIRHYLIAERCKPSLIDKYSKYRIAVVIPVFNEDPIMVRDTALSALLALKDRGDVYVLDDSTDEDIKKKIDDLKLIGINVFRRNERRGYKAGAVNDWLQTYGSGYDLMAIFDADQRPKSSFFDEILKYFDDPSVAFVQVPQVYSELETGISVASFWQQQPFLRIVMKGRKDSAFSLGSGTVYRTRVLEDVGGLDEQTVTEDVATSIDLHSRGWRSIYSDRNLVWYGEPPKDLKAYLQQQARWSLGNFQILPKLLKSDLKFNQFLDYIASWMYWFKEGPLTFFEILAPVFFLLLSKPFMRIDAMIYISAYLPFFLSTLIVFIAAARDYYGWKGFAFHQTVELLAFPSITSSFVAWLMRKKRPFIRTPKEARKLPFRETLPYWIIILMLVASVVKGVILLTTSEISELWFATLINVVWAIYFIPFFIFGLYIIYRHYEERTDVKLLQKI